MQLHGVEPQRAGQCGYNVGGPIHEHADGGYHRRQAPDNLPRGLGRAHRSRDSAG